MKTVHCAECGKPLEVKLKAVPSHKIVISVVAPHVCTDEVYDLGPGEVVNLEKVEEDAKFVQQLNDLEPPSGDRRPKAHLREEIPTTSAPTGILDSIMSIPDPVHGAIIDEEDGGD